MIRKSGVAVLALALTGLAGCAPALNWREFVPEGSGLRVAFPCRPDRQTRIVNVAAVRVSMTLWACSAADATFAVSYFDVSEPGDLAATMAQLQAAAIGNLSGQLLRESGVAIPGMTLNAHSKRVLIAGHGPRGDTLRQTLVVFTRGLRVYQATVVGAEPDVQAVEVFIEALKLPD